MSETERSGVERALRGKTLPDRQTEDIMNLKTKLIITFSVVIAVPLFLITIVFIGFMSMQPAEVATPQTKEFLGEMLLSVLLIMAMTSAFLIFQYLPHGSAVFCLVCLRPQRVDGRSL